jgi:hypothetical protein
MRQSVQIERREPGRRRVAPRAAKATDHMPKGVEERLFRRRAAFRGFIATASGASKTP